ncbi:MAG: alpha-keto acid decarboxylase family protein [Alphaproteobacteria bacterium]|nr:alpha-keto acid decarboxylase family protein [Alphaproteobacteria bacterium]
MSNKTQTVGEFLFDYLHKQGVNHAFGIPGDFVLGTCRWLEKSPIEFINMTHEPSVGFAADAYSRVTGGLGVAVVTYCVGGLNMVNSIAGAYAEKSPVVVISGGPSPSDRRNDSLIHHKVRTFDTQRRIYDEVTCASTVLLDPETAADEIIRVVAAAKANSRPVYIEVPFDVTDMPIKAPSLHASKVAAPVSDKDSLAAFVAQAAAFINQAKQPVIVADVELHRLGLTDLAVEFAKKFNFPIASTLLSKSVISDKNPLFIGTYSGTLSLPVVKDYVESSDCLIMLGAFISDVLYGFTKANIQRNNTILCTSEKASIGHQHYEGIVLKEFIEALLAAPITPRAGFDHPNPYAPYPALTDAQRAEQVDSDSFFEIIEQGMPDNTIITSDTGDALLGAIGLRTTKRNTFIAGAYYLSMGFGIPAAIGACAANLGGRVMAMVGDGAFQMTGLELSTAAKFGYNPIILLLNNDGYGTQRGIIDGDFNKLQQWKYTKTTDLIGYGKGVTVQTKGELESALKAAVADTDNLHFIEVMIPKGDCSRSLKRVGEGLAEQRDATKRQKTPA